jgi:hypothetical protein
VLGGDLTRNARWFGGDLARSLADDEACEALSDRLPKKRRMAEDAPSFERAARCCAGGERACGAL